MPASGRMPTLLLAASHRLAASVHRGTSMAAASALPSLCNSCELRAAVLLTAAVVGAFGLDSIGRRGVALAALVLMACGATMFGLLAIQWNIPAFGAMAGAASVSAASAAGATGVGGEMRATAAAVGLGSEEAALASMAAEVSRSMWRTGSLVSFVAAGEMLRVCGGVVVAELLPHSVRAVGMALCCVAQWPVVMYTHCAWSNSWRFAVAASLWVRLVSA